MADGGLVIYFATLVVLGLFFLCMLMAFYLGSEKHPRRNFWMLFCSVAFVLFGLWIAFSGAYVHYMNNQETVSIEQSN